MELKSAKEKSPASLAASLEIEFNDINILQQALLHSSYVNENPSLGSLDHNERLEFLGDAILSLVICEYLYQNFTTLPEGELTKIKSLVVSKPVLAQQARRLNLGDYLLLGRGEAITGGRERDSLLANVFESLIGAIYLDQGIKATQKFIVEQLQEAIHSPQFTSEHHDYKTLLQEFSQKHFKVPPRYTIIKEEGPDHAKVYHAEVQLNNNLKGSGQGSCKKEAEQNAAKIAFLKIEEKDQ